MADARGHGCLARSELPTTPVAVVGILPLSFGMANMQPPIGPLIYVNDAVVTTPEK